MKLIINPKYEWLRTFVETLPSRFDREGRLIHDGRNKLRVFKFTAPDGNMVEVNVKRYKVPIIINRIAYTFLRKPKGLRAYEYSQRLAEAGVETPEGIAYLELRDCGLMGDSYFVSVQSPYPNLMYHFGEEDADSNRRFIKAFARYSAKVHEAGILHKDLSPGNILYDEKDGEYRFCMIDINRMQFRQVDVRTGCLNFARLWGTPRFFRILAEEYASVRGADPDQCEAWIKEGRRKYMKKFKNPRDIGYDARIDD